MLAYVLQGITLGVSGAAVPGPLQAFLLAQTLRYGWKRALPATTAPLFSDGPIVVLVLFVLTQLPTRFLIGLRFAGGLFLLYLAWDAYRARHAVERPVTLQAAQVTTGFWKAVMTNFLNPNPYLFWSILAGPSS
ncbi:MAG: LysE family transporter [Ardenticatenia bacterium]|nr:LysE family transporter [Ardenticatenia bacterium]